MKQLLHPTNHGLTLFVRGGRRQASQVLVQTSWAVCGAYLPEVVSGRRQLPQYQRAGRIAHPHLLCYRALVLSLVQPAGTFDPGGGGRLAPPVRSG